MDLSAPPSATVFVSHFSGKVSCCSALLLQYIVLTKVTSQESEAFVASFGVLFS